MHKKSYRINFSTLKKYNLDSYIPTFENITPETLANHNDYFKEMLEIIQDKQNMIPNNIKKLKKEMRSCCLIHGDIKFNNFLINKINSIYSIKLVDWELSGIGDPLIDLGSVIGNLFLIWITNISLKNIQDPLEIFHQPLNNIHRLFLQINRFLKFYNRIISKPLVINSESKINLLQHSGAFLLKSVYNDIFLNYRFSPITMLTLFLSKSLLTKPKYIFTIMRYYE